MKNTRKRKYPKAGTYTPEMFEKGKNEAADMNLKKGKLFYTVWLDDEGTGFDVKEQIDAEILSRLVRIERKLKGVN